MTTLASDRQMRDNRLRNDGIQTDSFPTSTFKLTQPVALPAGATTGAPVDVTLHGDLTLHGVTKTVDIPAKAQLNGSLIQVLGSLTFPFSDYDDQRPEHRRLRRGRGPRHARVPGEPREGLIRGPSHGPMRTQ